MKRKLMATFLPLALVPLIGIGIFSYLLAKQSITEKVVAHLQSIASLQKNRVMSFVGQHLERFGLISDQLQISLVVDHYLPYPGGSDRPKIEKLLHGTKATTSGFQTVSILSVKGRVLASTDPTLEGHDFSGSDFIKAAMSERVFDVVNLPTRARYGACLAGPLEDDGNLIGVLLVEENLTQLFPWIRDYVGLGQTGESFLFKRLPSGEAVYLSSLRFAPDAALGKIPQEGDPGPIDQALGENEGPVLDAMDYRRTPVIATKRFIKPLNWGLVVKIDRAEAYDAIIQLRHYLFMSLFISILSIVLLTQLLAKSFVDPVLGLTQMAEAIQNGRPWLPLSAAERRDELGVLADAFVTMAEKLLRAKQELEETVQRRTEELTDSEERLRQSRAFLHSVVENIPNMLFVKDARDLRFVSFNKAGENLLGVPRDKLIGKNDYDFFAPEEADFFTQKDREVLKRGTLLDIEEEPIHTASGVRLLHTKKIPIFDEFDNPKYLLGISEDITERKRSERHLLEKQTELARSNAEREQLELFASVAAHDLQEPLQKIVAFGDLLRMEIEPTLNKEGQDYLARMRNAAKRMSELISDLLRFSRAATNQEPLNTVQPNTIIEEVLSDLELRIRESDARITVGPLPPLYASRVRLRELFQNLISNAIKFRRKGVAPEIKIHAREPREPNENTLVITVRDNGIGFDGKFAERIFRPFERLHRRSEYEGSGIGLAICQRIVARMGGKITAESALGEGAVFVINLPGTLRAEGEARVVGESSR